MDEPIRAAWEFAGRNVASIIAVCALGLAVYQAFATRRHNRLSVRPRLTMRSSRISGPEARFTYTIVNNGLGPAIIDSCTVTFKGSPVNLYAASEVEAALTGVLGHRPHHFVVGHFAPRATIGKDSEQLLFDLRFPALTPEDVEGIEGRLNSAHVLIRYRSMYGERFLADSERK
jgi:hypothetical protein